jgi:hypothetical protein
MVRTNWLRVALGASVLAVAGLWSGDTAHGLSSSAWEFGRFGTPATTSRAVDLVDCKGLQSAVGLYGVTYSGGLTALGLNCATRIPGWETESKSDRLEPSLGDTPFALSCGSDAWLTGLDLYFDTTNVLAFGTELRAIEGVCKRPGEAKLFWSSPQRAGVRPPSATRKTASIRCRDGQAVKAFRVNETDIAFNSVHVTCENVATTPFDHRILNIGTRLETAGNFGWSEAIERCQPGQAVNTLRVRSTTGRVDALGGMCIDTTRNRNTGVVTVGGDVHVIPFRGDGGPGYFEDSCDWATEAIVGMRFRTKGVGAMAAVQVQGVCANANAWANGDATTRYLPARGDSTGTLRARLCPLRQFLIGWKVSYDTPIEAVIPICAPPAVP